MPKAKKKRPGRSRTLTAQEHRFVLEYIHAPSAAMAARRAGYSPHSARKIASKLLKRPLVRAAVDKFQAEEEVRFRERAEKAQDELLQRVDTLSRITLDDFYDDKGELIPLAQLSPECKEAMKSYSPRYGEVKLVDRQKLLEMLARCYGMFVERHEISGTLRSNLHIYLPSNERSQAADAQEGAVGTSTDVSGRAGEPG